MRAGHREYEPSQQGIFNARGGGASVSDCSVEIHLHIHLHSGDTSQPRGFIGAMMKLLRRPAVRELGQEEIRMVAGLLQGAIASEGFPER